MTIFAQMYSDAQKLRAPRIAFVLTLMATLMSSTYGNAAAVVRMYRQSPSVRPQLIAQNSKVVAGTTTGPAMPHGPAAATTVVEAEKSDILSYQEWKAEKVKDATQKLEDARKDSQANGKSSETSESKVFQSEWNLETAQDLEITDYVVIYLSQFAGTKKFEEAAARLSKNEIALVMERYISIIQRGNRQRNTESKSAEKSPSNQKKPAQAFGNQL